MTEKIVFQSVEKAFGEKTVLRDFSATFSRGAPSMLFGASGCGKTTVLRLAAGLISPDRGTISGNEGRIGCVFQEDRLIMHLSAAKNVRLVTGTDSESIPRLLSALGLHPEDDAPVSKYSGGMRRRVAIARALVVQPEILLLDEPFSGLDAAAKANAARLIRREAEKSAVILLVTHDRADAESMGIRQIIEMG
ncbi:MAG: ATP-binding cassette domain-containing protein [Christensenellales bacterium]|jgi:NitT/TauT family transport system ATP-binding protein